MGNRVVGEYIVARPGQGKQPWGYLCGGEGNFGEYWGTDIACARRYSTRAEAVRRAERVPKRRGVTASVISVPKPNGTGGGEAA